MEEEKIDEISYKIKAGFRYRIWRRDLDGRTYYNIIIKQKNYDGTDNTWYRPVTFKKGVEVANETDIIIKKGFENLRNNPKDKYNPITSIMITEFETLENKELQDAKAYADYQKNLQENEMFVSDEDLPF